MSRLTREQAAALGAEWNHDGFSVVKTDDGPRVELYFSGMYSIAEIESLLADMKRMQAAIDAGKRPKL